MKSILIILINLVFITLVYSQEKAIKISNPDSQHIVTIKENLRVKIKTTEGKKISGKFQIIDNETISMKRGNKIIKLSEIAKIKRNPLFLHVLNATAILGAGFIVAFVTAYLGGSLLPVALTTITGLILSPNIAYGYKAIDMWQYEIIEY